jgi:cytidylate kinase
VPDAPLPLIVVVGPCASGKSTLAEGLRSHGMPVRVCGQEHSSIRNLWRRMDGDLLVALAVDLPTLRERRSPTWPESIYRLQLERLRDAYAEADLVLDTGRLGPEEVLRLVLAAVPRAASSP